MSHSSLLKGTVREEKEREIYSKLPTYGFVLEMNCGYTTLKRSIWNPNVRDVEYWYYFVQFKLKSNRVVNWSIQAISLSLSRNTINFKCANVVRHHQLNPVYMCDILDLQQQISFCCVFFLNTCRENTLWMQVI